MTEHEKSVIGAIIGALNVKRDRLGRLNTIYGQISAEQMRHYAREYGLKHGGYDRIDQATMLLQALIGEQITSIEDVQFRSN
jgi:hypothetical protein